MKRNKLYTANPWNKNLFAEAGPVEQAEEGNNSGVSSGIAKASQVASAGIGLVNNAISQAQTADISGMQADIRRRGNTEFYGSTNNDLLSSWDSMNTATSDISTRDIRDKSWGQDIWNGIQSGLTGAATGATVGGVPGAIVGAVAGLGSSVAGTVVGRLDAKKKRDQLLREQGIAATRQNQSFNMMRNSVDRSMDAQILASDFAFGGPFTRRYDAGGYIQGQTYDVDESEVQKLIDAGYQIQYE